MGESTRKPVIVLSLFVFLFFQGAQGRETGYSYTPGSESGPEKWGQLMTNWAACGTGRWQSPIDLQHERVEVVDGLGHLRRTYRPTPAVVKNRGHDIMVRWEADAGGLWINGTEYRLQQLHWHVPSEHTVDGRRFALELHMVHQTADNATAVVGVLYTKGQPDSFIAEMESHIRKVKDVEGAEVEVGLVNPWRVKWGSRKYYRYLGSLTAPPCTEGVKWTIIKKLRTVSREQLRMLKGAVHNVSRLNHIRRWRGPQGETTHNNLIRLRDDKEKLKRIDKGYLSINFLKQNRYPKMD
ncbi:hypothetical protein HPP92_009954 [Vanilla planifolia]|uniref:Carbonic anhydrase n=1 Tax=Vanilla planifolia TaxID=51239 RepID=A0A835V6T4_VANPL|nr:hypothetical protein HPP92_009954 [Vanilla planifolia]